MSNRLLAGGIIFVALLFVGAGCSFVSNTTSPETVPEDGKPKVAATIFPIYDLVRAVAGSDVDVALIISPGASPHYFEPTVAELRALQGTKVVFSVGAGLDAWAENIIHNIEGAEKIKLSEHISLRESEEHEDEEHEDEHGPVDPHYWLAPTNALVMIDAIAEELAALSPEHAEDFVARASALKEQLREKDVEWQAAINALPTKDIVTFHDAFMYFADDFGLTVIATFEPFPGKEPTAKYLQNLQAEIAAAGIADLFLEPQLSADAIESFARDNKIDLGVLDPIGGVPGRDSYISLIDYNVDQIVQSLQN